jgi:hypothetical protein
MGYVVSDVLTMDGQLGIRWFSCICALPNYYFAPRGTLPAKVDGQFSHAVVRALDYR